MKLDSLYKDNFNISFCAKLVYMTYYLTQKLRRNIGKNIQRFRARLKLKQVEVAVDAGINPSYYGKIERGIVNPSIEKIYRISKALKVKASELLNF